MIPYSRKVLLWNTESCHTRAVLAHNPQILGGRIEYDKTWRLGEFCGPWLRAETILAPNELRLVNYV